ncbi:hypothetical protein IAQ61_011608 [Plenodomus lingam]|uniref:uncharacterized protein n=1 Tax=Leptosphaeria maculans TaxID=5022 RepID=UPI00333443A7|nr:hypothetical protein IAQ61_011608 [Plenodomus lingam]
MDDSGYRCERKVRGIQCRDGVETGGMGRYGRGAAAVKGAQARDGGQSNECDGGDGAFAPVSRGGEMALARASGLFGDEKKRFTTIRARVELGRHTAEASLGRDAGGWTSSRWRLEIGDWRLGRGGGAGGEERGMRVAASGNAVCREG